MLLQGEISQGIALKNCCKVIQEKKPVSWVNVGCRVLLFPDKQMLCCLDIIKTLFVYCYWQGNKKRSRLSLCPTPTLAVTVIKPYQGGTKPLYYNTIYIGIKNADTKCSARSPASVGIGQHKNRKNFYDMQHKTNIYVFPATILI